MLDCVDNSLKNFYLLCMLILIHLRKEILHIFYSNCSSSSATIRRRNCAKSRLSTPRNKTLDDIAPLASPRSQIFRSIALNFLSRVRSLSHIFLQHKCEFKHRKPPKLTVCARRSVEIHNAVDSLSLVARQSTTFVNLIIRCTREKKGHGYFNGFPDDKRSIKKINRFRIRSTVINSINIHST